MNYYIGYLLLALTVVGCGKIEVSDSHHEVSGTATVRVVIGIDVAACEGLEPAAKAECIQSLIELAKVLEANKQTTTGIGGI